MTADLASNLIRTARQHGYENPFVVSAGAYSESVLNEQLGADATNIYVATNFDHSSAGYQLFIDELSASGGSDALEPATDSALAAWLAVHTFADVSNGLAADPTRQTVLDAMTTLSGYDTNGLTLKPLDYMEQATFLGGAFPNLKPSLQGTWLLDYKDGKLSPSAKTPNSLDIGAAPPA